MWYNRIRYVRFRLIRFFKYGGLHYVQISKTKNLFIPLNKDPLFIAFQITISDP